jgi:hypothetical protein
MGEVVDHRCGRCGCEYCPKCHGIKRGPNSANVLRCTCEGAVMSNKEKIVPNEAPDAK